MRATRLVIVALLLVTGTLLFASGQPPAEEKKPAAEVPVKLTFWGWGPHVEALNKEIGPAYNKLHPNVTVEGVSMGPWDLMDKFYTSMVTGKGLPDASNLVRRVIAKYLIPELLWDFTDFIEPRRKDFPAAFILDVTAPDGRILAIPPDYGPGVVYYDIALAKKLNVDVTKIRTWQDYYELTKRLSASNPDVYMHPMFYPGGSWGSNQWKLFAQGAGGNIYDEKYKVIRNNQLLRDVTEFYYKLHTEVRCAKGVVNDPAIYDAVRQGKLLFWPSNSYRAMEIAAQAPDLNLKLGTFPWPLWKEGAPATTGNWGGVAIVVPKKGPNAAIAADFAKFYATNETALTGLFFSTTGVPGYAPVRNKIMAMTDRTAFAVDLIKSIAAREVAPWNFADWSQTEKILGDGLDAMFANAQNPSKTWDGIEKQLINILGR
jgi:ABC-type glycerol-3-phosphate transport system substrate-binding protein